MTFLISKDGRKFRLWMDGRCLCIDQRIGREWREVETYDGPLTSAAAMSAIRQEIFEGKLYELKSVKEGI